MENKAIETLFILLNIKNRIRENKIRYLYLKDFWGLEQNTIAELEGVSQSLVSKELIAARKTYTPEVLAETLDGALDFTVEEIKYIQFLPREILPDVVVIAFVNNILKMEVNHPFYMYFDHNENVRICALSWLGVQNKHIVRLFNKTQPTVSMIVKRNTERALKIERINRYDKTSDFTSKVQKYTKRSFFIAGGGY